MTEVPFLYFTNRNVKSTGCDYFNFNILMGVPQVPLIVYSDVGILESQFLQHLGKKKSERDNIEVLCFLTIGKRNAV